MSLNKSAWLAGICVKDDREFIKFILFEVFFLLLVNFKKIKKIALAEFYNLYQWLCVTSGS